jgi:hypothetical protein
MSITQRLSTLVISVMAVLGMAFVAMPATAGAQGVFDVCKQGGAKASSVCKANGQNNLSGPNGIIIKVSNIFAFITGIAAVIVIMIGGFLMITAGGDTGKQTSGKQAVTYAVVGLVVVVVARAIIGFVITRF